MKNLKVIDGLLCAGILLSSCGTMNNTAKGGIIGGGSGTAAGAIIGGLIGKGKGAAIGAAVGAVVGTSAGVVIGRKMDKKAEAASSGLTAANAGPAMGTGHDEAAGPAVTPQKDSCTFDDFMKMDIRTATVLEAERVPKTDKLLKLTIDTGIDRRVIVSGIAEHYAPEQMIGRQICILANLLPRKIKGIESQGMILMARQADGKMRFITPEETLSNGAEIG